MGLTRAIVFVGKVGLISVASVTVVGLIFGGGDIRTGLDRVGSYLDEPVADFLMGSRPSIVGVDIRTQKVEREKSWHEIAGAGVGVAVQTAKDAKASLDRKNLTRPIDAIKAKSLLSDAREQQESLRVAVFGDQAAKIDAAAEVGSVLAIARKSPTQAHAQVATMLAMSAELLKASPSLRSYALDGLAGAPNVEAGSRAFAEMFTVSLCAAASDAQAKQWGLPTSDEMKAAGLPARKEAMARFGIASGGDPILAALDTATKASRRAAAKASVKGVSGTKPSTAFSADDLAAQAKEHGGSARIFVAEKFGAASNSPELISAKLKTRRDAAAALPAPAEAPSAPKAPFSSLGL